MRSRVKGNRTNVNGQCAWIVASHFATIWSSVRYSYPLMLDLSGRLVVIIGGGSVAARKVKGLLAAGPVQLRVVAPQISDEIAGPIERVLETYAAQHLDGAGLVFAAT